MTRQQPGTVTVASDHGTFTTPEPPGSDILRQKLARAEVVPLEQRKAEEAAFIESVPLMRAICQDLPLTEAGKPQLPATPATRQRVLLAALAAARCHYICPLQPSSDTYWEAHLAAYEALFSEEELTCFARSGGSGGSSGGGSSGDAAAADGAPLSGLIKLFAEAANAGTYVQLAWKAAGWLNEADNWPAVRRQLAQLAAAAPSLGGQLPGLLAGAALPSVEQLRYIAWVMVYEMSNGLLGATVTQVYSQEGMPVGPSEQLTPAQEQAAQVAEQQAAAMLVQLEPDSPRSHLFAGEAARTYGQPAVGTQHLRRCIRLSQALPSRYWRMRAATTLLSVCTMQIGARRPQDRALMEYAVEEFERAQRKLDVCKKRLPLRWTDDIGGAIGQLTPLVEAARAQLRGDPGAGPQAVLRQMNEQLQQTGIPAIAQWEGCGLTSAGLRACAGCRAVQYCSPDCQRRTWPSHKKACKAAQAAAQAAAAGGR